MDERCLRPAARNSPSCGKKSGSDKLEGVGGVRGLRKWGMYFVGTGDTLLVRSFYLLLPSIPSPIAISVAFDG